MESRRFWWWVFQAASTYHPEDLLGKEKKNMGFKKVRKNLRKITKVITRVSNFFFHLYPPPICSIFLQVYFFIIQLKKKDKNVLHNKKHNTKHVLVTLIPSQTQTNPISNTN
jgi:hypothetical protein